MATRFRFDPNDPQGRRPRAASRSNQGVGDPRLRSPLPLEEILPKFSKRDLDKVASDIGITGASRYRKDKLLSMLLEDPETKDLLRRTVGSPRDPGTGRFVPRPSQVQRRPGRRRPSGPTLPITSPPRLFNIDPPRPSLGGGSGGVPPGSLPPGPASPPPGDDGDDEFDPNRPPEGTFEPGLDFPREGFPDPRELEKERRAREAHERRLLRLEINRRRRAATETERGRRKQESLADTQRRREINRRAREMAKTDGGSSASDRIIRRLASFSIGRSLGAGGQLFAALSELFVFQPEEALAEQRKQAAKLAADQYKEEQIRLLEGEKLGQGIDDLGRDNEIADAVEYARIQLQDPDRETRERTLDDLDDKISGLGTIDPRSPDLPESSTARQLFRGRGGPGGTVPPSGTVGAGAAGGGGTGAGGTATGLVGNLGQLNRGLHTTTKLFIGAAGAIQTLGLVSETATQSMKGLAAIASDPGNEIGAMQAAGEKTTLSAKLGGSLIGSAVGGLLGGPKGAILGGAVGSTIGKTIVEPIVESILSVQRVVGDFADQSIGPATAQAKALGDVQLQLEQIERSLRLDELTSEFVQVRTDLRSTLGDTQELFIQIFQPLAIEAMEILNNILRIINVTIGVLNVAEIIQIIKKVILDTAANTKMGRAINSYLTTLFTVLTLLEAELKERRGTAPTASIMKEVEDFFQSQDQFRGRVAPFGQLP